MGEERATPSSDMTMVPASLMKAECELQPITTGQDELVNKSAAGELRVPVGLLPFDCGD